MFFKTEKLGDLISRANGTSVMVKFINRTSRPAYLEMMNREGDRELKYTFWKQREYNRFLLPSTNEVKDFLYTYLCIKNCITIY